MCLILPSREFFVSHLGKFGKSSTQNAILGGYVSVPWRVSLYINDVYKFLQVV